MRKYTTRIMIVTGAVILFLLFFFEVRKPVVDEPTVLASIDDDPVTYADFLAFSPVDVQDMTFSQKSWLLDQLIIQKSVHKLVFDKGFLQKEVEQAILDEKHYHYVQALARELDRYFQSDSVRFPHQHGREMSLEEYKQSLSDLIQIHTSTIVSLIGSPSHEYTKGQWDQDRVVTFLDTKEGVTVGTFRKIMRDLYDTANFEFYTYDRLVERARMIGRDQLYYHIARDMNLHHGLPFRIDWEQVAIQLENDRPSKIVKYVQTLLSEGDLEVSEKEISDYYETHRDQFRRPDLFKLQGIQLGYRKKAEDIYQLAREEEDFTKLVETYSVERNVEYTKGRTGYEQVDPSLYKVLIQYELGEVIPPQMVDDRWEVYKILGRIPGAEIGLNQAKPDIIRVVMNQKWKRWLKEMCDRHEIEVKRYYQRLQEKTAPAVPNEVTTGAGE